MNEMMEVPIDFITSKDLDYLSDMFQWNYSAYKSVCNDVEYINDKEISDLFNRIEEMFDDNLNLVLKIINNPGGDIDE